MYYLSKNKNPFGNYSTLQKDFFQNSYSLTDEQAKDYIYYNGCVNILEEPDEKYKDSNVTLVPNTALWEKWSEIAKENTAEQVRNKRDKLLLETDWTQIPDVALNEKQKQMFKEYRQTLRDIPQQPNFPEKIDWPKKPKGDNV